MFEPKCDWWRKIRWEDKTVLLKGILSIKREDYGRFVELALDAGMREALAGDYDVESQSGEFWFDAEKEGPRGILNWLGFSVEDETEEGIDFVFFEDSGTAAYRDDMGRAVFEACAPVIGAGSVLVFMENWDEAKAEDPRIWRYTFDHRGGFGPRVHGELGRGRGEGPAHLALHVRWREDARPRWSLRLRLGGKRGIREGAPFLMEEWKDIYVI